MRAAPPLRVWLYSVALVLLIMVLLVLYRTLPGDRRDNTIAGQTEQFLAAPPPAPHKRLLALGSSLLWAATPQRPISRHDDILGMESMRMTKGGTGMGYLLASLDVMEQHPPDILVIEENLLLPDSGNILMDPLREEAWHLIRTMLATLHAGRMGSQPPSYWERNDQEHEFSCSDIPRLTPAQIHAHALELQKTYQRPIDPGVPARLTSLVQRGMKLVVLNIRRSAEVELITQVQKGQWHRRLKEQLPPSNHVRYLDSPSYSLPEAYCDGGHLNAAGAHMFAPWWHTQLQLLKDVD